MKNKTILITGASGFLGTWLADELFEDGFELVGIDLRAPLKPEIWSNFATAATENVDWENLLHGKDIFGVCHLAGGASVGLSMGDPYSDFSNLMPGTARLALYLSKYHNKAKFIFYSSGAVYGNSGPGRFKEGEVVAPISPYGIHKRIAEVLLENYSRVFSLQVIILRIFSIYGPGLRKQLIWDVCKNAILADRQNKQAITLFGTGNETRDFIHVKDLCGIVAHLLTDPGNQQFEIYNVASGKEKSVAEIARSLIRHLNFDIEVNFNGQVRNGDPLNMKADVGRLENKGIKTIFDLDNGLKEVAKWIKYDA